MSEILLEKLKVEIKIKPEKVALSLENFIRKYTEKLEREGVILGLSGGIDSAVIAALCMRALGQKKTFALIMPGKDSKKGWKVSDIAEALEIKKDKVAYIVKLDKFFIKRRILNFVGRIKGK